MPIEANVTELQVAETLLQLHCGIRVDPPAATNVPRHSPTDHKMEIESAATLFLNCFATPDTPSTTAESQPSAMSVQESSRYSVSSQDDNSELNNSQSSMDSPIAYRAKKFARKSSAKYRNVEPKHNIRQVKQPAKTSRAPQRSIFNENRSKLQTINLTQKKTRDQGTQTDEYDMPRTCTLTEIAQMDAIVKKLYARIRSLEDQLRDLQASQDTPSPTPVMELDPDVSTDVLQIQRCNQLNNSDNNKFKKRRPNLFNMTNSTAKDTEASDDEWRPEEHKPGKHIFRDTPQPKGTEMVPIGEGYATVPRRLLKQIDWSSYTGATRKLLTAVFSRRVLATHSLTGKPSPAFPGKPAKKRLEPELVNDIVQVVVERCGVPESVVRTSITTKCADESKMYRSRQQNKKKTLTHKLNQENVPPSDDSSDE